MFAADDNAVHSQRALCPLWSTYTTQTHGSVKDTLPHTVVGVWWISADGTFSPTRNLITMRCSSLRDTSCSLITLATPRQDWTGSNPSRRESGGCGFTLSRSHSCCAVRLVFTQISPGHIWTTLYILTHIAHTLLLQTFTSYRFTTHIYPSHYAPFSPLPYTALPFPSLHF